MKTKCQAHKLRRVLACVVMLASLLFISTLGSSYAQSEQPPTQEPAQPAETGDEEMPLSTHTPSEPQPEPQDEPPRAPLPADAPICTAGVDRYVATTGTDSGDCDVNPCKTVNYATSKAVSGDTIHIAAGTYLENLSSIDKSLTYIGAGMNQTILDGNQTGSVFNSFHNVHLTITDMTIRNGKEPSDGGGIATNGPLTLARVAIIENATYGGGAGGGIYASNNTTMQDVVVSNNQAEYMGAGILLDLGSGINAELKRVTISNNKLIGDSVINTGGGLQIQMGNVSMTNVTISQNSAFIGAAFYVYAYTDLSLLNVTITNNNSTDTNSAAVVNNGNITFRNTILAGNSPGNCKHIGDSWTSHGYNIDSGNTCSFNEDSDQYDTDPLLQSLANNGGFTRTHALLKNSPAVDAGDNSGCPATDQRNRPRPQDGNNDGAAVCDIGAYELDASKTFKSSGAYDGWVLESTRTSSKGGSLNRTATTLRVGDDAQNRHYRSILHFNTASLPDNAVITAVKLQVKRASYTGSNPFDTHGALYVDLRKGAFSNNNALQLTDWQAAASKSAAGKIPSASTSNWHTLNLAAANLKYINKKGVTQLRLRFNKQDNGDNGADYVNFYSGNAAAANRPKLIITYYVP